MALKNKRRAHTCAVMSNGQQSKIVVAGGTQGFADFLSSVEIFDPTVNNWIPGKEIQFYFKMSECLRTYGPQIIRVPQLQIED